MTLSPHHWHALTMGKAKDKIYCYRPFALTTKRGGLAPRYRHHRYWCWCQWLVSGALILRNAGHAGKGYIQ